MRMWGVQPDLMCDKHLLGEHVEMHMFVGAITKGTSLLGYTRAGLVDVDLIKKRHDQLAKEMKARGMNHKSPILGPLETMYDLLQFFVEPHGQVDPVVSQAELLRRCARCRSQGMGVV